MSDVCDANDANDVDGVTGVIEVTDVSGLTGVNDENYASVAIGYALVVVLVAFLDCPCYQPCFPFDPFELSVVRSAFMESNQTLDKKIVIYEPDIKLEITNRRASAVTVAVGVTSTEFIFREI